MTCKINKSEEIMAGKDFQLSRWVNFLLSKKEAENLVLEIQRRGRKYPLCVPRKGTSNAVCVHNKYFSEAHCTLFNHEYLPWELGGPHRVSWWWTTRSTRGQVSFLMRVSRKIIRGFTRTRKKTQSEFTNTKINDNLYIAKFQLGWL